MFTPEKLLPALTKLSPKKTLYVAYSGGLDSHVLLHALASLKQFKLHAIHINHGLSPNATAWQQHCEKVCNELTVPLQIISVDAKAKVGESPEAVAREVRYQAFAKVLATEDYLVTAHQQDDQAETLLLQLFRGAGPKGLASMSALTDFARGFLCRPLLNFTRIELQTYATQNDLQWLEDESNTQLQFDRNFIRLQLMPLIKARWPGVLTPLARVAKHCGQADALLTELAEQDLKKLSGSQANTLSIKNLLKLDFNRQNNVLRFWLHSLNFPTPSEAKLQQLQQQVLHCREDAMPKLTWQQTEVRRYGDDLYAMAPLPAFDNSVILPWDLQQPLTLPGDLGQLTVERMPDLKDFNIKKITVRFRQGGERCQPQGRQGSHPLKKLFQEWGVPPWLRDRVPLLYYEDELIAVVGFCIVQDPIITVISVLQRPAACPRDPNDLIRSFWIPWTSRGP